MIKRKQGFTLVELAIVIVVIGLIIGGVVKGQELITNAKINSVINQVNGFKSAFATFEEKYGGLPGDFSQAQVRLPGCADAAGNCANGNGDGSLNGLAAGPLTAASAEARMAWQHLAYANLITGVVPGASTDNTDYGTAFPAARTGGGFTLINTEIGSGSTLLAGVWVRLQKSGPAGVVSSNQGEGALSPGEAAVIDRKMDDGNPLTGFVRASGHDETCAKADGSYDESTSSRDCDLFFYML